MARARGETGPDAVNAASAEPRRRMSAPDRRATILAAALEAFSERGFDGASLDDIAARNGTSKALIYEHFSSKRELQMALLDANAGELLSAVIAAIERAEPGEDRLHAAAEALLDFVENRPGAWTLLTRNVSDPVVAKTLESLREHSARTIAALMAEEAPPPREGGLPVDVTVAGLAHMISGGVQFLASWWLEHPDIPRERILELIMDFAWIGLERVSGGEIWRPAADPGKPPTSR